MMIGGGMMYMLAALVLLGRWLALDAPPPSLAGAHAPGPARTAE
jgi:hypothetical protein